MSLGLTCERAPPAAAVISETRASRVQKVRQRSSKLIVSLILGPLLDFTSKIRPVHCSLSSFANWPRFRSRACLSCCFRCISGFYSTNVTQIQAVTFVIVGVFSLPFSSCRPRSTTPALSAHYCTLFGFSRRSFAFGSRLAFLLGRAILFFIVV